MDALPEDWQAVPNEKEKCEEITRLTVLRSGSMRICIFRAWVSIAAAA